MRNLLLIALLSFVSFATWSIVPKLGEEFEVKHNLNVWAGVSTNRSIQLPGDAQIKAKVVAIDGGFLQLKVTAGPEKYLNKLFRSTKRELAATRPTTVEEVVQSAITLQTKVEEAITPPIPQCAEPPSSPNTASENNPCSVLDSLPLPASDENVEKMKICLSSIQSRVTDGFYGSNNLQAKLDAIHSQIEKTNLKIMRTPQSKVAEQKRLKQLKGNLYLKLKNTRLKPLNHKKVFRNLYKLSLKEQEFAAQFFTAFGEDRSGSQEEMMMILKVVQNRLKHVQEGGNPAANSLDIVLQDRQFSMYNAKDPNWREAVMANGSEKEVDKALKAILAFPFAQFTPDALNQTAHYYNPKYVERPNWAEGISPVSKIKVAGTDLEGNHLFYSEVAWQFKGNPWRAK